MNTEKKAANERYGAEANERWGGTEAGRRFAEKTAPYTDRDWAALSAAMDQLMRAFSACMQRGEPAASKAAQVLVRQLQETITAYCYPCTDRILAGLGRVYTEDERFRNNINAHAEGTAAFIREAIEHCCRTGA